MKKVLYYIILFAISAFWIGMWFLFADKGESDSAIWSAVFYIVGFFASMLCCGLTYKNRSSLAHYINSIRKYRFLVEDMVARDIKLKYRRSVIGLLWSVLNPLLMMVVITAVFNHIFRFEVEHFAAFYLTGWVIFNFVIEATTGAMTSIIGAGPLIRKVYMPKYIFPIQKCLFSFVNMLFSLLALILVMLVTKVDFSWCWLLVPIPLLLALGFAIGLGMVLATAAVFLRDVIYLYGVFSMVWMYLTPIIYPESILVGFVKVVMRLNPMYYYVDVFRKLTLYSEIPPVYEMLLLLFITVISIGLGCCVFKKKQNKFVLYV